MSSTTQVPATVADLALVDGKAELVGGRIVYLRATGRRLNLVAGRIYRHLAQFLEGQGRGEAYTDNIRFVVPELTSGRESFSPDVSCSFGPFPANDMRFIEGPPTFAVDVRSENDYKPAAAAEMAAKRADYFEAGTLVVWDVDPIARSILAHRPDMPDQAEKFIPGREANAEPAVPGWRVGVDWVFA